MPKKVFIPGIAGRDGSFLAHLRKAASRARLADPAALEPVPAG